MKPESTSEIDEIKRIGDLLDRDEWDFNSCPADRLYFGFTYEYARESPSIRGRFEHAKKYDPSQFDNQGTWHHVICYRHPDFEYTVEEPGDVIDAPRGFPDVPYLKTTHLITVESHLPLLVGLEPMRPVRLRPDGTFETEDDWYCPETVRREEVVHFCIDRNASKKAILESVARWLEHTDHAPREKRGRSEARRCRSKLKALAAVRLMRHFNEHGLTAEDAATYTAGLGVNDYQGLFVEMTDWYAAKREVQAELDHWLKG